ncbi:MAG TPA: hypothetical protein VK760_00275, partial [Candidatus Acidoferrales bacterium]|nr:hypothetical protein [Candidatus Acidoferrales bacterium]
ALRRFAHEAAYINDRSALLVRALKTVRDHTTAQTSDILLLDGSAEYLSVSDPHGPQISENDPAIVSLRAWSKPLDLHDVSGSRLQGELAFPMASRGRLVAALVCGPKRDGEAYAPDETEALAALARGVGGALDVLDPRGEESTAAALDELVQLVRALPDALAKRLFIEKQ